MSILSSTKSGLQSALNENMLVSLGYKKVELPDAIKPNVIKYTNDKYENCENVSIYYYTTDKKFKFVFKAGMCVKRPEDRLTYDKRLIFETGNDVKLLNDFLVQTDIKIKRKLENKLLALEEKKPEDKHKWMWANDTTMSYSESYENYTYKDAENVSYFKSPKRNYKWW